jgi:hypothetical protein
MSAVQAGTRRRLRTLLGLIALLAVMMAAVMAWLELARLPSWPLCAVVAAAWLALTISCWRRGRTTAEMLLRLGMAAWFAFMAFLAWGQG